MDTSYTGCGFTVSAHSFHPACDNLNVSFAPSWWEALSVEDTGETSQAGRI